MPMLNCYVDDRTMHILEREAAARGRKPVELAEAAIENAALECLPPHLRGRPQEHWTTELQRATGGN